jgi:hypothetical protein
VTALTSILDRASATTFNFPAICLISVVYCPMRSSCWNWRGEQLSRRCAKAACSGHVGVTSVVFLLIPVMIQIVRSGVGKRNEQFESQKQNGCLLCLIVAFYRKLQQ